MHTMIVEQGSENFWVTPQTVDDQGIATYDEESPQVKPGKKRRNQASFFI